ncbi:hypothetical protein CB1_001112011 [Camelus ferus]|nr:hypothetical protein CB1_001112011 [Camelus ferus]
MPEMAMLKSTNGFPNAAGKSHSKFPLPTHPANGTDFQEEELFMKYCAEGIASLLNDGKMELVMLLLEYDADTTVVNGNGQTAKEVTHDKEIRSMLEAVERTQQRKLEELLLAAAREGKTADLTALLNRPNPPDVNCSDQLGNTPLHCAAYRAHKQCALKLLKSGADPNLKNKNDQKPLDLAQGAEMKHILVGNKVIYKALKRYEGPLWKDQLTDDEEEDAVSAVDLKESLEKAQTCQQRLDREISNFLKMIKECDMAKAPTSPGLLTFLEAELPQVTCDSVIASIIYFVDWFFSEDYYPKVRNFKLEQEQEKNKILSEALETLATEHHELEQSLVKGSPPVSILSEEEFYDALSDSESERTLSRLEAVTAHSFEEEGEHLSSGKHRMSEGKDCGGGDALSNGIKKHRVVIRFALNTEPLAFCFLFHPIIRFSSLTRVVKTGKDTDVYLIWIYNIKDRSAGQADDGEVHIHPTPRAHSAVPEQRFSGTNESGFLGQL